MPGVEAGFLEVQVGNQQCPLARPVERTPINEREFFASERKGNHARPLP
jgi:hypothetical protein